MAVFRIKSDITKLLLKEFSFDASEADNITPGRVVTLGSTAGTITTSSVGAPMFIVLNKKGYSQAALNQATVIYGGVVEFETDNFDSDGGITAASFKIGDAVDANSSGQYTTSGNGTAIGYVVDKSSDTITIRASI